MTQTQVQRAFIADRSKLMIDMWRLNSNLTTSDQEPINANLERVDNAEEFSNVMGDALINAGMTQSSGVFTFPSTGKYFVRFQTNATGTNTPRYIGVFIQLTNDNGTTYKPISTAYTNLDDAHSSGSWITVSTDGYVDITDTSTHKVRFNVNAEANVTFYGSTGRNYTYMEFIRVGET